MFLKKQRERYSQMQSPAKLGDLRKEPYAVRVSYDHEKGGEIRWKNR